MSNLGCLKLDIVQVYLNHSQDITEVIGAIHFTQRDKR